MYTFPGIHVDSKRTYAEFKYSMQMLSFTGGSERLSSSMSMRWTRRRQPGWRLEQYASATCYSIVTSYLDWIKVHKPKFPHTYLYPVISCTILSYLFTHSCSGLLIWSLSVLYSNHFLIYPADLFPYLCDCLNFPNHFPQLASSCVFKLCLSLKLIDSPVNMPDFREEIFSLVEKLA